MTCLAIILHTIIISCHADNILSITLAHLFLLTDSLYPSLKFNLLEAKKIKYSSIYPL